MPTDRPIRLLLSGELSFGPGKAELLEHLDRLGSLQAAAAAMEMSYLKAWKMVKGLNQRFREPLVLLHRGGKQQGGAILTPAGRQILDLYHAAVDAAEQATAPHLETLRRYLS